MAAQELCVATQANLNEEASRQERRDAELEELKQLCIETQANMNKQLTTPEGQKDAELAELRELCIQTQAKLCEDAGAEESLRAQLAKKEAELGELTQLCIETQKSLNEQAAEEEKSIAALKEENAELQVRAAQPLARFRPAQSRARACAGAPRRAASPSATTAFAASPRSCATASRIWRIWKDLVPVCANACSSSFTSSLVARRRSAVLSMPISSESSFSITAMRLPCCAVRGWVLTGRSTLRGGAGRHRLEQELQWWTTYISLMIFKSLE